MWYNGLVCFCIYIIHQQKKLDSYLPDDRALDTKIIFCLIVYVNSFLMRVLKDYYYSRPKLVSLIFTCILD